VSPTKQGVLAASVVETAAAKGAPPVSLKEPRKRDNYILKIMKETYLFTFFDFCLKLLGGKKWKMLDF
jgi:hypothetical protein